MVDGLEGALLPWRCLCCGSDALPGLDLCLRCRDSLPWNHAACPGCALPAAGPAPCAGCRADPPPYDRLLAPLRYAFPIDRLLVGLKFRERLEHGRLLGTLLAGWLREAAPDLPRGLPLLPMPLHRARLAERGFNQAAELARIVAPALEARVVPELAVRLRPTPPQSTLDAAARRRNLAGAFAARDVPSRLLVLDDVVTTGATARELCRSLRTAGCERVTVIALARVALPSG